MLTPQLDFFRETMALRGAGPSNFYTPYNPVKCISSLTWGAGRPHVGLCPIFLVVFCFYHGIPSNVHMTCVFAVAVWHVWASQWMALPLHQVPLIKLFVYGTHNVSSASESFSMLVCRTVASALLTLIAELWLSRTLTLTLSQWPGCGPLMWISKWRPTPSWILREF